MNTCLMEQLETRVCLAATAFAGVGYGYMADGWDGYLFDDVAARYEGTVDLATGIATYDTWVSAPGGEQPSPMGTQLIRNFTDLGDGRVAGVYETNAFDPSFGYPIATAGTNFLESEGYPIGWSLSEWDVPQFYGETKIFQLFVEKPTFTSLSELSGTWDMVALYSSWTYDILASGTGSFTIAGTNVDGQVTFEDGFVAPLDESILAVSPDGLVRLTNGDTLQLGADGNVLLFAGMDYNDIFGIGVAFRRDSSPSAAALAGVYRVGALWSGDLAWTLNGTAVATGTTVLTLEPSGSFSTVDTTAYDLGSRVPTWSGFWSVQGGRVVLTDGYDVVEMLPAHNARTLYNTSYAGSPALSVGVRVVDSVDQYTLAGQGGSVVRAATESSDTGLAVARNADGDLVVFRDAASGWEAMRLSDHTNAPRAVGDALIWTDPNDGLTYVAGPSVGGFILYKRNGSGDWSYRNLSNETTAGGNAPIGTLTYFITRPKNASPQVMIAGANATGQIVALQQTGLGTAGSYQWRFYNISADLASQGMITPQFSEMVSYVTSWNQWTLAGLDASGNVQGVWIHVDSFTTWRVDNLSSITGAAPLVGQLDVTLTTWGGIRFAGANATGRLVATWWNPGLGGGNWKQTDLSGQVPGGGPLLFEGKLTAWFTPLNVIAYAGFDSNGDVTSYYWQPGDSLWSSSNLTISLANRQSRPTGTMTSHVSRAGTVSIVGLAQNRDVVRLWWTPAGNGNWYLDNLTSQAIRV